MTKRPGATSDNGFILKEINKNLNIKQKKKLIYFLKYEIIVRTSAWSLVIQIPIQAVCNERNFVHK